ncbi:MAG: branched-chain amino acid transport system II carrier protein [Clostridiales bacterium]|nr:branched-chain amino acid transport system II carrier protein [Clostridiales bacterium]
MKRSLTLKETVALTSMLFGMFFGAGNLIFPAILGINAGSNIWSAFFGVFVTAVGIPMLAVVALGLSRSEGVVELSGRVSKGYSLFFCTLLYLTIGPLFAIPRCASTAFSVGAVKLLPAGHDGLFLALFSLIFFAIVLYFSLKPGGIMTWIGKWLNPVFLLFLAVLVIAALLKPITGVSAVTPATGYETGGGAFFRGFLEGYNTLDALAGLAFGIVVIDVVRSHGVSQPEDVARSTAKAGIFSCLFMGFIYLFITLISTQSAPVCASASNGGEVLGLIADHYFQAAGSVLLTAIVTFACLKTAIGLVTSCSKAFVDMFPKGPGYNQWAVMFSAVSFGIANFGLSSIVAWCVPVLMFLYPLAITLVLLALFGKTFGNRKGVYVWTTAFTLVAAVFDMIGAVSGMIPGNALLSGLTGFAGKVLPLYSLGLGWVCPAAIGFIVGLVVSRKEQ